MVHRCSLVLLLGLCAAPAALRATVLVPAEFREVVNGSDVIAYGLVVDVTAEWGDDRKRIDTLVTLQVGTYLKGGPGDTLIFKVPGGRIGRYRNVLVGAPVFQAGDEAIVFLKAGDGEVASIFGLNQGVFRVRFDAQSRRRLVVPPAVMARGESPETVLRGSAVRTSVPLETFGAQVRSVMGEAAARGDR